MAEIYGAKRQPGHLIARAVVRILPLLVIAGTASAQYVVSTKAGIIQYIEGDVFLGGSPPPLAPDGYPRIENGQSLRTKQGCAELLLSPGAYLRLGENGLLRMEQNTLDDTQLALVQGSALIEVVRQIKGNRIRIRFLTSVVEVKKAGLYRLDAASGELRVYGGAVLVASRNRKATIKTGKMVRLDGDFAPDKFDVDAADSLHEWAARRSFDLFVLSSNTRTQTHWTPITAGWLRNYNYRMSFCSPLAYDELTRNQPHQEMPANQATAAEAREIQEREIQEREMRERAAQEQEALERSALERAAEAAQAGASQTQTSVPQPSK
jgi:hypothetical protein